MRRHLLLLAAAVPVLPQSATLVLEPITGCVDGFGRVKVSWNATGPNAVRVLVGTGQDLAPLSGLEPASGSTETGLWVTERMRFALVDESGRELASATASLDCDGTRTALGSSLEALGWMPLQVGNRWVYRSNTRQVTAAHYTRTVTGTEVINGQAWFVLDNPVTRLRTDAQGRLYELRNTGVVLLLDPATPPSEEAVLRIDSRTATVSTPFGQFPGSLDYRLQGFRFELGTYVRGLGLLRYSAQLLAGSSGGFLDGADLVEARIAGRLYFRQPAPGLAVGAEKTVLEVTMRKVTNCAVPCYFTACRLVPGADPEGTYKPCFEARVAVDAAPAGSSVELSLEEASGRPAGSTIAVPLANPSDFLQYRQLPLYSAANQPFPPGAYRLRAKLLSDGGAELANVSLAVEIR